MELQMKSLMAMLLCKRNYYNPASDSCENKLDKVYSEIKELNIYDILEPSYHGPESKITTDTARVPQSFRKLGSPSSLTPAGSCRYDSSLGSSLILWIVLFYGLKSEFEMYIWIVWNIFCGYSNLKL